MQASFSGRSSCSAPLGTRTATVFTALRPPLRGSASDSSALANREVCTSSFASFRSPQKSARYRQLRQCKVRAVEDDDSEKGTKQNTEFGYSRKDVLLIGFGLIAVGYALYYTAQALGVEATTAGNYVQLFVFLVICVGYISTYILRVANKDMTYARQLEAYEERVMQKRLEEMPETERERLLQEVEKERSKK